MAVLAAAPIGYQKFKQHRAAKLADEAITLAKDGQTAEAQEAAEAAFNLAPDSPASLRAKARSATEPSDIFFFSQALLQIGDATPADARLYLQTCLELNLSADIDKVAKQLIDSEPNSIENWLLVGRINLQRGRSKLALECAGKALELNPENRQAKLLTAEIAQTSTEEKFRKAADETLDKLIAENPDDQVSLSAQLARLPDSADQLIANPLASVEQKLLAAQHQLWQSPDENSREKIIANTIAQYQKDQLPALLHWLNSSGAPDRALELANFEKAATSAPLFTAWCHAMIAAGRTTELIALVEPPSNHSKIPLVPKARQLVLIDAYEAAGKPNIAELFWNKLLRETETGNRRIKILRLAQWAEKHNYNDRAIQAYRSLLEQSPEDTPFAYDRIAAIARRSNQLPLLRKITDQLRIRTPENIVYQHNFAYLSAIAGEDLDIAAEIQNELIQQSPQPDPLRCTLALIEKQRGNQSAVATQLAKITPENLDPVSRYIYLKLSGQPAPPPDDITPYELDAIGRL